MKAFLKSLVGRHAVSRRRPRTRGRFLLRRLIAAALSLFLVTSSAQAGFFENLIRGLADHFFGTASNPNAELQLTIVGFTVPGYTSGDRIRNTYYALYLNNSSGNGAKIGGTVHLSFVPELPHPDGPPLPLLFSPDLELFISGDLPPDPRFFDMIEDSRGARYLFNAFTGIGSERMLLGLIKAPRLARSTGDFDIRTQFRLEFSFAGEVGDPVIGLYGVDDYTPTTYTFEVDQLTGSTSIYSNVNTNDAQVIALGRIAADGVYRPPPIPDPATLPPGMVFPLAASADFRLTILPVPIDTDFRPKGGRNAGEVVQIFPGNGLRSRDLNVVLQFGDGVTRTVSLGTARLFAGLLGASGLQAARFEPHPDLLPYFQPRPISLSHLPAHTDDFGNLGAVDLRDIRLVGADVADGGEFVEFLVEGEPTVGTGIDVGARLSELEKVFLQALAIPKWEQYVSLDMPSASQGLAHANPEYKQTELGQFSFEADSRLKQDVLYQALTPAGGSLTSYSAAWMTALNQTGQWPVLDAAGYDQAAWGGMRSLMKLEPVAGRREGGQLVLLPPQVKFDNFINGVVSNEAGLDATQAAIVQEALSHFKQILHDRMDVVGVQTAAQINSGSGFSEYEKLRRVLPAVIAAHWYRTLRPVGSNRLRYEEVIDSRNITGLKSNQAFDQVYWDGQANRDLGTLALTSPQGLQGSALLRGGVHFRDSAVNLTNLEEGLSDADRELFEEARQAKAIEKNNKIYFVRQVAIPGVGERINLTLAQVNTPERTHLTGKPIDVNVTVSNFSPKNVTGAYVRLYAEFHEDNGDVWTADERGQIIDVEAFGSSKQTQTLYLHQPGLYRIRARVEACAFPPCQGKQELTYEDNEGISTMLEVFGPTPQVELVVDAQVPTQGVDLTATIVDKTESGLNWTLRSDVDGILGTGTSHEVLVENVQLTAGEHLLELKVQMA